jgi:hypothetical protein
MKNVRSFTKASVFLVSLILVVSMFTSTGISGMYAAAQSNSSSNMTSVNNATTSTAASDLDKKMQQLADSNNPTDIATLAYIYGFSLVAVIRTADFTTSPNIPPADGRGPYNTISNFRDFPNASFTDIVRPNVDTLYSIAYFDLSKEPLVLKVPPIADRYYSLQFIDAYSNNFHYIGTRMNDTKGDTYLLSGPNWQGATPSEMKQIKSPTNNGLIGIRILVKSPDDVSNVHSIQDQFNLSPLSAQGIGNSTSSATTVPVTSSNASKEIPVAPDPALIPITGITIYDEIGKDMARNAPPEADSAALAKLKTIGIGPSLTPSQSANDTVKQALENGITNGQQLINGEVQNIGANINGWNIPGLVMSDGKGKFEFGNFGTDYLLRAGVAAFGLFANSAEEAVYPTAFQDSQGQNLTGMNNYVIHFDKGQLPPVKAFWSVTLYNDKSYLADNPINRYNIGGLTPGLKNNTDGSLDIYIQHDNPGKDKESNWLPSPVGDFSLNMRLYVPEESVLNGQYQYPPIKQVTNP